MLYMEGMKSTAENKPIGIMADSHGNNGLLLTSIVTLKSLGAGRLIHLGDMCDSLSPHLIEETLSIMKEHGVEGIRGNNECTMIQDYRTAHREDGPRNMIRFLDELPYIIRSGSLLFTHSAPLDHPVATKRPISEFMPLIVEYGTIPFSLLFRGHSHRPSVLEIEGHTAKKISLGSDKEIPLDRNRRYVITVGAVENASSALFLPEEYSVRFIALPKSSSCS
jgi:predicted phosphodiesterase